MTEDLTKALRDSVILVALEAAEKTIMSLWPELPDNDTTLARIRAAIALVKKS